VFSGNRTTLIGVATKALLAMLEIAAVDYLTGYEIHLSVFYLLPIGLLAWRTTLPIALGAAIFAAILWVGADLAGHQYSHPFIGVWNGLVRLSIFAFGAVTLSRLRRLLELERTLARTDSLTGVYNAWAFTEVLDREILRSKRTARPFYVVFLDLDRFKALNDRFGHATGDEVLRQVGALLRRSVRATDSVGRLGGDEFGILLTETDEAQARAALERVQGELGELLSRLHWSSEARVTASFGAVVQDGSADVSSAELLKRADSLMYQAKQRGGNQVALSTRQEIDELPIVETGVNARRPTG
jgi:diguanylate cyclase (GGDEF)-like protein